MTVDPEALFIANQHRLFRYLRRAVGQTDTARDLTQDVFLRVSRTEVPKVAEGEVTAWLFSIARNLALDHHRKRVRRPNPDEKELTLRPGESWLVYTLRNIHGYSCGGTSSIRVSVDNYPWEEDERRLVVADLWLVERLSNGSEAQRSQPLSVRGLPNRPSWFYFDSIVDANVTFDIYGTLVSRLQSGVIAISVETRSRWAPGSRNVIGPQRSVKSDIHVKPAETVEIRLPMLGDEAGPFAKRYSIRLRARQLRWSNRVQARATV